MRFFFSILIAVSAFSQAIDYRTQVVNKPEISVMDYPYLAKGNGVTNDCAVIQQAHDDLKSAKGGVLLFPMPMMGYVDDSGYYMGTDCHLNIDVSFVSLRSTGRVLLDFRQLISGVAITFTGTHTPNPTTLSGQTANYVEGFILRGPGNTSSTSGMRFYYPYDPGSGNKGTPYLNIRNSQISEFGRCLDIDDNTYLLFIENTTVNTCTYGMIADPDVLHVGENINIMNSAFVSNITGIKWGRQSSDIFVYGTSFDFQRKNILEMDISDIYFVNSHFEMNGPSINDNWINVEGSNTAATFTNCQFVISGGGQPANVEKYVFNSVTANSKGGIRLDNVFVYFTVNAYKLQFLATGDGPIMASNFKPWSMGFHVLSPKLNILANPGFESSQLNEWILFGTATVDQPKITSLDKHSGNNSMLLRVTSTASGISRFSGTYPCTIGSIWLGAFWLKMEGFSGAGGPFFRMQYQYYGRDGILISSSNGVYNTDQSWELEYSFFNPTPPGCAQVTIIGELVDAGSAQTVYIDDMAYNDLGNSVNALPYGKIPFGCYGITNTATWKMLCAEFYNNAESSSAIYAAGSATRGTPMYRTIGNSEYSCIGANCPPTTTLTVQDDGFRQSTRLHIVPGNAQSGPLFSVTDGTNVRFQVNANALPVLPSYTLGTLPAANTNPGAVVVVTGASAGTAPCGAGSDRVIAISNGTQWVCP